VNRATGLLCAPAIDPRTTGENLKIYEGRSISLKTNNGKQISNLDLDIDIQFYEIRGQKPRRIELLTLKRIFIPILFSLAVGQTDTKADNEGYSGVVIDNLAAAYVVRMDDGKLLDAEWTSGYDDWSSGDRVILTTESGGGYMYNENGRTQVDVFPYNPADIGDL
jgi:hypothetical protein